MLRYTYIACIADIWSHMRRLKYVIRVPVRSSEASEILAALAFSYSFLTVLLLNACVDYKEVIRVVLMKIQSLPGCYAESLRRFD